MSLFRINDIRLNYNVQFKRISLVSGDDFISLTMRSFEIFMSMVKVKSSYDKIKLTQSTSELEILQLCGNFILHFQSSKNLLSKVIIKEYEAKQILDAQLKITEAIKKRNELLTKTNIDKTGNELLTEKSIDKKRKLDFEPESSLQIVSDTVDDLNFSIV